MNAFIGAFDSNVMVEDGIRPIYAFMMYFDRSGHRDCRQEVSNTVYLIICMTLNPNNATNQNYLTR